MGDKKMPESLRDQAHDLLDSLSDDNVRKILLYLAEISETSCSS